MQCDVRRRRALNVRHDACVVKIISWNMNNRPGVFDSIPSDVDIALTQETPGLTPIENGPGPAAVHDLSGRYEFEPLHNTTVAVASADGDALPMSHPGTWAAARIRNRDTGAEMIVVSVYVKWERVRSWIVPDASAHRLVSDLSSLISTERHRTAILVAGDWNAFRNFGETAYLMNRYQSIFDRMELLGFTYLGPSCPPGTRPVAPPTDGLEYPADATPTYYTTHQDPTSAWRQLDYVYMSTSHTTDVTVRPLNKPGEWGPSDHCRILIDVPL